MSKRLALPLLLALSVSVAASAASAEGPAASAPAIAATKSPLPAEYKGQPLVWIPRMPDIDVQKLPGDGRADQWKNGAAMTLHDPSTRLASKYDTQVRMFCSDKALYIAVRAAEPKMDSLVTRGEFWNRDEIEISLEPYGDAIRRPYHYVNVDCTGKADFHRFHVYPKYFQERALAEKWEPKVEIASVKGKDYWAFEMKIPFDQLKISDEAAARKTLWRLNVCRIRPARPDEEQMLSCWANLDGRGFQVASRFGYALPEPYSSPELVAQVAKSTALPPDPSVARATSADVQAQVDKLLAELGAAGADRNYDAAKKTGDAIALLAKEGTAMYGLIEGKLSEAAAKAKKEGQRSYSTLRDFAYTLDQARPDDDPPPEVLVKKIESFEAREFTGSNGKLLRYRLLKPKDYDPKKKYPLALFMHGSAEVGDDNLRQLYSGVWEAASEEHREKFPCFLLVPQCPRGTSWADTRSNPDSRPTMRATNCYRMADKPGDTTVLVLELLDSLQKEFPAIDSDRLYVSGGSMGGYGTYEMILRRPDMFAAAMPVCGGGDETRASTIAKLPIWIFHGEKDESVKVEASRIMFKALKDAGGNPKYTEVPGAPHSLGSPEMKAEVWEWLFAQKRPK